MDLPAVTPTEPPTPPRPTQDHATIVTTLQLTLEVTDPSSAMILIMITQYSSDLEEVSSDLEEVTSLDLHQPSLCQD